MRRVLAATICAIGFSVASGAQVSDKQSLDREGARAIIHAAINEAKRLAAPGGVIAVVDDGGNLIAVERLDGTFAAGANISIGKARTAALFKRPTKVFEDIIRGGRTPMVALSDFTPFQGGVPVVVNGAVIGAVGVSGAASAQQDEDLAIAGAAAITGAKSGIGVRYYASSDVASAFAKGAVLFSGENTNYMIHASRRDKPGQAEVHKKETDLIYVLDGTATFVTGGKVAGAMAISPDEIRGDSIEGGETRALRKGDIIIVPAGTPHWFKEVNGPFLYHVVKVQ